MRRALLLIIGLGLLGGGGSLLWGYSYLRTPLRHDKAAQYISIHRGSSPQQIVDKLATEGIVAHELPLLVYLKVSGRGGHLRAGEYRFPSPISPLGVVRRLEEGEQRLSRFTVIEGWTRWDIATSMSRVPELKLHGPDEALALMDDCGSIRDIDPDARNLEGYLFPDTYNFPPDVQPTAMIAAMVKRFRQEWKPEWSARAESLHLTPRQIVTVASLIETEAKLNDERPIVASVIYNRLKSHMALGIDSTVIYASKLAGKWKNDGHVYQSDLDRQSPYNTRLQTGLPPGPIASPGAHSLLAALNPAGTTFLYYVRDPTRNDGAHNFYSNAGDFERGVKKLREWEQRQATEPQGGFSPSPSGDNP